MSNTWTLSDLWDKLEWEGYEYLLTDLNWENMPEEIKEDVRIAQESWRKVLDILNKEGASRE